jgi:hypothetical protein
MVGSFGTLAAPITFLLGVIDENLVIKPKADLEARPPRPRRHRLFRLMVVPVMVVPAALVAVTKLNAGDLGLVSYEKGGNRRRAPGLTVRPSSKEACGEQEPAVSLSYRNNILGGGLLWAIREESLPIA